MIVPKYASFWTKESAIVRRAPAAMIEHARTLIPLYLHGDEKLIGAWLKLLTNPSTTESPEAYGERWKALADLKEEHVLLVGLLYVHMFEDLMTMYYGEQRDVAVTNAYHPVTPSDIRLILDQYPSHQTGMSQLLFVKE